VAGPDIQHKTELKGIEFDLQDENTFMAAWHRMNRIWPGHIWAEQQIQPGLDLMVGAFRDPDFGPVLLFGTGGEYVELYEDIARLLVPVSDSDLYAMIRKTKVGKIIEGIRGQPRLDVDRVVDLLQWTADWIRYEPRIQALDMNPVRLFKHDMVVLDAKITLKTQDGKG
jgi:acetyltransferase